jgi:hypothetical protein
MEKASKVKYFCENARKKKSNLEKERQKPFILYKSSQII